MKLRSIKLVFLSFAVIVSMCFNSCTPFSEIFSNNETREISSPMDITEAGIDKAMYDIQKEYALVYFKMKAPVEEVKKQSNKVKVNFKVALREALNSLLVDNQDPNSVINLMKKEPYRFNLPDNPTNGQIKKRLIDLLNHPSSYMMLVGPKSKPQPLNNDPIDQNWVFVVQIPKIWKGVNCIVVDKKGEKKTYNYGYK